MKAQGYLEIDYKEMSDDEFEEFNAFLSLYMINYKRLSRDGNREYYYCILKDESKLHDKEIEEEGTEPTTEYGLMTLMADRNPIINGMWFRDGIPFGMEEKITFDLNEEGDNEEVSRELLGEAKYNFDLSIHLKYTPDEVTYNEEGIETERTEVTTYKPLHSFYGWVTGNEY